MNSRSFLSFFWSLVLLAAPVLSAAERPNILLILTDDLGYSDLGSYGSEIETPTLDRLAAEGLRFSQFYNTAKCHSSRVSLLSGRWCRQAGDESLSRAVTIPEVLAPSGYFTAMSGKWHLSKEPTDFGFQRYFGHLSGACNFYKGDKTFRLNGEAWEVPAEGFYTTVAKVDYALEFLEDAREAEKPWFLYLAYNAPHAPLQPLKEDYERYLGNYDQGWDAVREARVARQQELGLFGQEITPSTRPDHVPAWEDLTPEVQDWEARRMAAIAAMIDRVDQETGRLVADLEANGELDNTIILFFSDNGACPYDRNNVGMDRQPYEPDVTWSDSTGWSWARNSPFRFYKQNQFEGGVSTPGIVHWPAGLKTEPGSIAHEPAHLVDVLPTLAEITGAEIPDSWPGRELTPLAGTSLTPIFEGEGMEERPPIHFLFSKDRGLRDGDWKLVSFQSQPWELYDLTEDRAETQNLAAQYPERVTQMAAHWTEMTRDVLMAPKGEYAPVQSEATGNVHREWSVYTGENGANTSSHVGKAPRKKSIRARIGTELKTDKDQLILTCTGDDPGLAFDHVPGVSQPGPYTLTFQLTSDASGDGELYFVTEPKKKLPGGEHQAFQVTHDGKAQKVSLTLPTQETLHGFRLDVCAGPGTAIIQGLTLKAADGKVLRTWPK